MEKERKQKPKKKKRADFKFLVIFSLFNLLFRVCVFEFFCLSYFFTGENERGRSL